MYINKSLYNYLKVRSLTPFHRRHLPALPVQYVPFSPSVTNLCQGPLGIPIPFAAKPATHEIAPPKSCSAHTPTHSLLYISQHSPPLRAARTMPRYPPVQPLRLKPSHNSHTYTHTHTHAPQSPQSRGARSARSVYSVYISACLRRPLVTTVMVCCPHCTLRS